MYVGIDIGTGSLKAVLGTAGGELHVISRQYPAGMFKPGIHSQEYFIEAFRRLMQNLSAFSSARYEAIEGISFCGHGPSIILVSADGELLTDIITWQDNTAVDAASELRQLIPGFTKDGTCFEAKLLKLYRESNDLFQEPVTALYPKDLAVYLLTGRTCLDHSTASTLAFYDKGTRTLDTACCGIPSGVFPELVESWEIVGVTSSQFAEDCGLAAGIPVVTGGIDAWCEAIGAGAVDDGMMVDGTGTSTCITRCWEEGATPLLHVIPQRGLSIETMSSTGASIAWVSRLTGMTIDAIRSMDVRTPLPLIYLPYLNGERSPVWDEKASASFIGMSSGTTAEELVRSVLQGISFGTRQCIEIVHGGSSRDMGAIRAVGGGANNRALLQYKANITGAVFHSMKETDAAPLGAMILASYAGGAGSIRELTDRWVNINFSIEPEGPHADLWDELYAIYDTTYAGIRETSHRLSAVRTKTHEITIEGE